MWLAQTLSKQAAKDRIEDNPLNATELQKLSRYLQTLFQNPAVAVKARPKLTDSAELYVGDEFVGIVSKIVDEGETSYDVSMSILDIDLED